MKIWDKNIKPSISEFLDNHLKTFISNELKDEFLLAYEEYINSLNNYKKEHNKFKYWLYKWVLIPLSIFPGFFIFFKKARTKFKEMDNLKNDLLSTVEEKKKNKLNVNWKVFNNFNEMEIIKGVNDVLKYEKKGPLTSSFINTIKESSLFNLESNKTNNSSSSHWAVINNSIVVHSAQQTHKEYMKTYTGSTSVSYTWKDFNGNTRHGTDVVQASYKHKAYDIWDDYISYTFVESCQELEFDFRGEKGMISSFDKKNDFTPLENEKFNKEFKWWRTNEVQFRMFFTPFAQETYLIETENSKNILPEHKWTKKKAFIKNEFEESNQFLNDLFIMLEELANKPEISFDELLNSIKTKYLIYANGMYNANNFNWMTTLLQSEDHNHLIHKIENDQRKEENLVSISHYILREIINKKIIVGHIDTFNEVTSVNVENINNTNIYHSSFYGTTYNLEQRIKTKTAYSIKANRLVNVDIYYDEYLPLNDYLNISFIKINSKNHFFNIFSKYLRNNIEEDAFKAIEELNKKVNVSLIHGYIAISYKEDLDPLLKNEFLKVAKLLESKK